MRCYYIECDNYMITWRTSTCTDRKEANIKVEWSHDMMEWYWCSTPFQYRARRKCRRTTQKHTEAVEYPMSRHSGANAILNIWDILAATTCWCWLRKKYRLLIPVIVSFNIQNHSISSLIKLWEWQYLLQDWLMLTCLQYVRAIQQASRCADGRSPI